MTATLKPHAPFAAPVVDLRCASSSTPLRALPAQARPTSSQIEHVARSRGRQMTSLACEWGLSLHLEFGAAGDRAQFLLDFGYTPRSSAQLRPARHRPREDRRPDSQSCSSRPLRRHDRLCHPAPQPDAQRPHFYNGGEEGFREKMLGVPRPHGPDLLGPRRSHVFTAQFVKPVCCNDPHDLGHAFTTGFIDAPRSNGQRRLDGLRV